MLNITSRLSFTRTLGSTVMLGIMLFLSVPAATYAAAIPDVIVTSLSYANGVFTSTVKNQGTGASPSGVIIGVSYRVDGVAKTFSDTAIGPLAAGASKTIGTSAAPYTIPDDTIMAYVDDVNRFAESNETNNKRSQSITINSTPTLSLTANPVQVSAGGAATLSWASQHTTSCTASAGWSGIKGTSGMQAVQKITSSQTYILTCAGTTTSVSKTVKVAVISTPPPPPVPDGSLSGPGNCAEAQSNSDVVFCQDFDGSALGDWSVSDLKSDFPGTSGFIAGPTGAPSGTGGGRTTIVSGGDAVSGNSLRAKFPKNTIGSNSGAFFRAPIGANLTEAYIGYWVRFEPLFPDIRGGKLPGLEGGTTDAGQVSPCCGRPMKKGLGFSTRLMFVGGRSFVNYFYWIDNPTPPNSSGTIYGGPRGKIHTWIPGKWYFIEEHVKLNTPANALNGLFEVWINGTKVTTIANARIRGPGASFSINHILFHTYLGGNESSWYSPKDTYNFFDVVVVSRNRIGGPGGG